VFKGVLVARLGAPVTRRRGRVGHRSPPEGITDGRKYGFRIA
jgi:hypothetical protein